MANKVVYTPVFIKKAKALSKKYASLISDLTELEKSLTLLPKQGADLGGGLFKVRLAVKSKGKGKSGGFRVVTYLVSYNQDDVIINMLTIYDKSEESSINKKLLLKLLKELYG